MLEYYHYYPRPSHADLQSWSHMDSYAFFSFFTGYAAVAVHFATVLYTLWPNVGIHLCQHFFWLMPLSSNEGGC